MLEINETRAGHAASPHLCHLLTVISFSFKSHLKDFLLRLHAELNLIEETVPSSTTGPPIRISARGVPSASHLGAACAITDDGGSKRKVTPDPV